MRELPRNASTGSGNSSVLKKLSAVTNLLPDGNKDKPPMSAPTGPAAVGQHQLPPSSLKSAISHTAATTGGSLPGRTPSPLSPTPSITSSASSNKAALPPAYTKSSAPSTMNINNSNGNMIKSSLRDSVSSDVTTSRPNSTTSEDEEDDDDEEEDGDEEDNDDEDEGQEEEEEETTENSENGTLSSSDDGPRGVLEPISEEHSSLLKKKSKNKKCTDEEDDSTCCDEDFTWVRNEPTAEPTSQPPASRLTPSTGSQPPSNNTPPAKPPRPAAIGSLDRRQTRHSATNRNERDSKSRSTHSLKEKTTGEFKVSPCSSSNSQLSKGNHDSGYQHPDANYYSSANNSHHYSRSSPAFWEPPPPPAAPPGPWDHYYNYQGASREDMRMLEYHRRQHDMYRYGSNSALSSTQDLYQNGGNGPFCPYRYGPMPVPSHHPGCCGCEHKPMGNWNGGGNQRSDTDERIRRLQSDKDALTLQVQVLNEQVLAQNDKIGDMERLLTEKNQMLANAEDLLQREMLSRSSLETQKLELMSAMSELKLQQAALERENMELRANSHQHLMNNNNNLASIRRPPIAPNSRISANNFYTSTPTNATALHGSHGNLQQSTISPSSLPTPPASYRQRVDFHYNSLPRQSFATPISTLAGGGGGSSLSANVSPAVSTNLIDNNANPMPKQRNVAFAETEKVIEDNVDMSRSFTPQPSPSPALSTKNKGLRSIFGKIKRSTSGNLEDLPGDGEFRRGGLRSTAGGRLGWSGAPKPDKPFAEWDVDALCCWLDEMGLGVYEEEVRKWLKNGAADLITASPVDIEKELSLKSPLHRKKIVLALNDITDKDMDELFKSAAKLDTNWILRWLDDIGLPQYKDSFLNARMDGRMLHKLTMDDLVSLHITSCLHVASLRRGIQIMRNKQWDPECLIRRSKEDDNLSPEMVTLWTAHRVMEWLRVVDLAEYAPNLRGAGVHGALMIFDVKFTAELLANLLSIPPSKSLLRRHLATHFKDLLGRDVIQAKRDAESTLGFQALSITAKIKTPKKSQFSLKRKKSTTKGGDEWSDFVCPMGSSSGDQFSTSTTDSIATTTNNNTNDSMTIPTIPEIATESEAASPPSKSNAPAPATA